jgi:hypothetical protein
VCWRSVDVMVGTDGVQWLVQAHLSTEDYDSAMQGLRRVRRFRRVKQWVRYPLSRLVALVTRGLEKCWVRKSKANEKKVLVWKKESTYHPTIGHSIVHLTSEAQHLPFHEVDKCPLDA